jgi:hypothetical protein
MSESFQAEPIQKAGFTRRRFIIGGVGVSAVAAIGGTTVRAPRVFASTAPSGPPTTTIPLPTTTEPEQLQVAAADLAGQPSAVAGRPARPDEPGKTGRITARQKDGGSLLTLGPV